MAFIYDLTDTWNAGGTTFSAIKMNVTDTASAAASKLITLQVGGVERFGVDKAGAGAFGSAVRVAGGSTGAPALSFTADTNTGIFSPAADTVAVSTGGAERLRVDSLGRVGIGTASPSQKLTVFNGSSRTLIHAASDLNFSGAYLGTATSSNRGASLELLTHLDGSLAAGWRTATSIDLFGGTSDMVFSYAAASTTYAGLSYSERMRITATGGVAIGTTTDPGAGNIGLAAGGRLQFSSSAYITPENNVSGAEISTPGAITLRTNNAERMRITAAGSVGIGTSAPTARLDVSGADARVHGLTVGRGAGSISSNTAFGPSALFSNTTGTSNTAVGASALLSNTTGVSNTAVGSSALQSNTTGNNNTTVGVSALRDNTTGANNTAVGRSSLLNNTTGANNTAVGASALQSNATGASNTATGVSALLNNTTGNNNTATGLNALANNTTGSGNTVFGLNAGSALTTGSNNTIIGRVAGTAGLDSTVIIAAGTTERMRIDSSGNLLVGTTSSTSTAGRIESVVGGAVAAGFTNDSAAALPTIVVWNKSATAPRLINFRVTGSFTSVGTIESDGTSTIYGTSSDARLKENIAPADDAAALIDALQVRKFDWKVNGAHHRYGMIAQELLEVAPEAVSGDPEGEDMMGVDYSKLVPMLIKELQSVRARLAQLEGN